MGPAAGHEHPAVARGHRGARQHVRINSFVHRRPRVEDFVTPVASLGQPQNSRRACCRFEARPHRCDQSRSRSWVLLQGPSKRPSEAGDTGGLLACNRILPASNPSDEFRQANGATHLCSCLTQDRPRRLKQAGKRLIATTTFRHLAASGMGLLVPDPG